MSRSVFCALSLFVAHLAGRCAALAVGRAAGRATSWAAAEVRSRRDPFALANGDAAGSAAAAVKESELEACHCSAGPPEPKVLIRRGDGPLEELAFDAAAGDFPLAVPPNGSLVLSVCGAGNAKAEGTLDVRQRLPGLVGPVGEGARVRVEVCHSWNAEVSGGLNVRGQNGASASLMPSVVSGTVGAEAQIQVECHSSGNVHLKAPRSELQVADGGALLSPVIDAKSSVVKGGVVEVNITGSGNVIAADTANATITFGHLVDSLLAASSVVNSSVRLSMDNSANVVAASLEVNHGNLINGVLSIKEGLKGSDASLTVRQAGTFQGEVFSLNGGELVDEIVDCGGRLEGSKIGISAEGLGNVKASSVRIMDAELVDEVVDTRGIDTSSLKISLVNMANVQATTVVSVSDGKLLDETVDADNINRTAAEIELENIGNVKAPKLIVDHAGLVDEIVDADMADESSFTISVRFTASFDGDELHLTEGQLMDEIVDVSKISGSRSVTTSWSNVGEVSGQAAAHVHNKTM